MFLFVLFFYFFIFVVVIGFVCFFVWVLFFGAGEEEGVHSHESQTTFKFHFNQAGKVNSMLNEPWLK